VFRAIHEGNPDQRLLAYQYMQMLPQIAQGDANKVWIVPSEIGKALEGIGGLVSAIGGQSAATPAGRAGAAAEAEARTGRSGAAAEAHARTGRAVGPLRDGAAARPAPRPSRESRRLAGGPWRARGRRCHRQSRRWTRARGMPRRHLPVR
jgi:hypothetical protein